jgi:glycosyltransferase involved in cell wall biosynthesis
MLKMIAIKIATYQRSDGRSPEVLTRALESIKSQTYQNYKVYLIGDKYDNSDEFIKLSSIIDPDKIYVENLSYAKEREKYTGLDLWCSGGVNAMNYAIDKILSDGIDYICHLDHDDWWDPNHLQEIINVIKLDSPVFIATKSYYKNYENIFPKIESSPFFPKNGDLIHSSVCIDFNRINLRYRDRLEEGIRGVVSDGDMWDRISELMKSKNINGKLIKKVTCYHIEEGYSLGKS